MSVIITVYVLWHGAFLAWFPLKAIIEILKGLEYYKVRIKRHRVWEIKTHKRIDWIASVSKHTSLLLHDINANSSESHDVYEKSHHCILNVVF